MLGAPRWRERRAVERGRKYPATTAGPRLYTIADVTEALQHSGLQPQQLETLKVLAPEHPGTVGELIEDVKALHG